MEKLIFEDCINLVGKKVWDNTNKKYVFIESVYHSYNYIKGCNEVKITFIHDGTLYDINDLELYKEKPNIHWKPKYDEEFFKVYKNYYTKWEYTFDIYTDGCKYSKIHIDSLIFKSEEEAKKCCEVLNFIEEHKLSKNEITDKINNDDNIYELVLDHYARVIKIEETLDLTNTDYFSMRNAKEIMGKFSYQELVKYYFRLPVD